ncbi:MAG: helix-turn-helix transcriptional regulator [Pseudomonadota bacterium]
MSTAIYTIEQDDPHWLQLLKQAVNDTNSHQSVADKLGISRASVSLAARGKYPAKTDKLEAKVLDVYSRVTCPHTGNEITHVECRTTSTASTPTSSPQAMRQWRACQSCVHKGGK